jgi:glutathionyl-hydroquinone reductase
MTISTPTSRYASPSDVDTYGAYRIEPLPGDPRPLYRFAGRVTADGSSGFRAEPGRYHLYAGWFCPWAQRSVIVRALKGLQDVVGLSYVHGQRDARGWAFRKSTGADPVNGFTLLRQAYEATEPGFDGHVSVPVLWDIHTGRIVSNTSGDISLDLGTAFEQWASTEVDTYPVPLRGRIDDANAWLLSEVNTTVGRAAVDTGARIALLNALETLEDRLGRTRFLLGDSITEPDVRLYVTLVRYDVQSNVDGRISERKLVDYRNLWAYARDLHQHPAFGESTNFAAFAPAGVGLADWLAPVRR